MGLDFSDRVAIVTGAGGGLGREHALALARCGAKVVVNDPGGAVDGRGNSSAAEKVVQEIEAAGGIAMANHASVTDFEAVQAMVAEVMAHWGRIDILVNNAGIRRDAVLAMMREEDWRRVLEVNLTGGFVLSRCTLPLMLKQKYGRILFVTSPMGHLGFAGQSNYAASKAGQVGLMKSLSKEVAKRKITVNCVSPGFIATDFLDDLPEAQMKDYKKMVPAGRFGTPAEVAEAALFLLGDRAAYINGAVLEITGGL